MAKSHGSGGSEIPPAWSAVGTHTVLWHGTLRSAAASIRAGGIDLGRGRDALDFGRGFYTTTNRGQAAEWARKKYALLTPTMRIVESPAVLRFRLRNEDLASLLSLTFVRGDPDNDVYWSCIYHCRNGGALSAAGRYDLICGPVSKSWPPRGRETVENSDQFNFHTAAGVAILNSAIKAGRPNFEVLAV